MDEVTQWLVEEAAFFVVDRREAVAERDQLEEMTRADRLTMKAQQTLRGGR